MNIFVFLFGIALGFCLCCGCLPAWIKEKAAKKEILEMRGEYFLITKMEKKD